MPLILPTTIVPVQQQDPAVLILYGAPKVGKTELLNQNPDPKFGITTPLKNCLHVDYEKGAGYIEGLKLQINTYEEFIQLWMELKDKNPKPYKYICHDTIDKLESFAERRATINYRDSIIGKNFSGYSVLELPQGAGYLHLRNSFHDIFDKCKQMADRSIFIGHIRDKNLTNSAVGSVSTTAIDLDLTGKIRNIACANADAIGYVYRNKLSQLCVNFETRDEINCGSRAKHLKGIKLEPFDWSKIYVEQS